MGRPPCCDKVGIKKGPWTPEEDIILVSYIQEHGPGNWRSVPTNTGLMRCSKSCRLRWTNYLRPGIKRGNFTSHEEGMIIHLQALLGNKWATIASYLPQRTDNDIKNYWNTHLKKKIKKFQSALDPHQTESNSTTYQLVTKAHSEDRNIDMSNQASFLRLNQTTTYASSTENISRLLEGWMKSSPKAHQQQNQQSNNNVVGPSPLHFKQVNKVEQTSCDFISNEDFESFLSFENMNNMANWEKSSSDSSTTHSMLESKQRVENHPPFSLLEKWLLDDTTGQVEEVMELSPISDNLPNL